MADKKVKPEDETLPEGFRSADDLNFGGAFANEVQTPEETKRANDARRPAVQRFGRGFLETVGPTIDAAEGALGGNPVAAMRFGNNLYNSLVNEPGRVGSEISKSWNSPTMSQGAYHGISAIPLVGSQLQSSMDKFGAGDWAGGTGNLAGLYALARVPGGGVADDASALSSAAREAPAVASDALIGGSRRASETPFKWGGRGTLGGIAGGATGFGVAHSLGLPYWASSVSGSVGAGLGSKAWPFVEGAVENVRKGRAFRAEQSEIAARAAEKPTPSRPSPPTTPLPKESPKTYEPFTMREVKTNFNAADEHPAEYNTSPFADFAPGRVPKGTRVEPGWKTKVPEIPQGKSTPFEPIPPDPKVGKGLPMPPDPMLLQQLLEAGKNLVRRRFPR